MPEPVTAEGQLCDKCKARPSIARFFVMDNQTVGIHACGPCGIAALSATVNTMQDRLDALRADRDAGWAAAEALAGALEMVERRWTFNNDQHHTHNWHDWADCMELLRPALATYRTVLAARGKQ